SFRPSSPPSKAVEPHFAEKSSWDAVPGRPAVRPLRFRATRTEKGSWDAAPGRPAVRPPRLRAARTGPFIVLHSIEISAAGDSTAPLWKGSLTFGFKRTNLDRDWRLESTFGQCPAPADGKSGGCGYSCKIRPSNGSWYVRIRTERLLSRKAEVDIH